VWHSSVFDSLVRRRDELGGARWGDAAVHTVSVISSLHQSEIHRFEDIRYEALMNPKGAVHKQQDKWKDGAALRATPLFVLEKVFRPRRFGWMGGDVAASFALPPEACSPYLPKKEGREEECGYGGSFLTRFVWLFGDTIIGTSSAERYDEQTPIISYHIISYHMH
jgi:hypothetical protein